MRLEYDVNVDDSVDTTHRAMARSKTVRSVRSRTIWFTALISGPLVPITWAVSSGSAPGTPTMWAVAFAVAVVGIVFAYWGARWSYDWTVSRRIRRIVLEQFGKAASVHCEIELRSGDFWTRENGTEVTLPWQQLDEVVDTGDAIELRFRNALVVARNRVFSSPAQRAEFLSIAEGNAR